MEPETGTRGSGARVLRAALIAVAGVVAGVGLAMAWASVGDADGSDAELIGEPPGEALPAPEVQQGVDLPDPDGPTPPGGADNPEAAVRGFLSAEEQGALTESFSFLSADDRGKLRSPEGWEAVHADRMPPVRGFEIGEVTVDGSRAKVASRVRFESSLNDVTGLIPARARVTWSVVDGEGGWGIALGDSRTEPRYPDESQVPDAARTWLEELGAGCEVPTNRSLVGSEQVLDPVCEVLAESDGDAQAVELGDVTTLADRASRPFVARYGGDATSWARVVRLTEPAEIGLVLAPIGDRWEVIGVVDGMSP